MTGLKSNQGRTINHKVFNTPFYGTKQAHATGQRARRESQSN